MPAPVSTCPPRRSRWPPRRGRSVASVVRGKSGRCRWHPMSWILRVAPVSGVRTRGPPGRREQSGDDSGHQTTPSIGAAGPAQANSASTRGSHGRTTESRTTRGCDPGSAGDSNMVRGMFNETGVGRHSKDRTGSDSTRPCRCAAPGSMDASGQPSRRLGRGRDAAVCVRPTSSRDSHPRDRRFLADRGPREVERLGDQREVADRSDERIATPCRHGSHVSRRKRPQRFRRQALRSVRQRPIAPPRLGHQVLDGQRAVEVQLLHPRAQVRLVETP